MYQVIIIVHVLLGLGVIGFVLIQHGKGADAGAAFGSASSGSVFGAQGASSFLSRTTAILATLFFATSLGLAVLSGYQGTGEEVDLMDNPAVEEGLADTPIVNDEETAPIEESLPTINEEVPQIIEDSSKVIDNTSQKAKAKVDETAASLKKEVEEKKGILIDKVKKTLDKE